MKIGFGGEMGRRVTQAGATAALSLFLGAGVASASPDTLRMALEDILFGAVDVVVAPVNGGRATARNLDEVSDNAALQGLYAVPAALGLTTLQALQGLLRTATGIVELPVEWVRDDAVYFMMHRFQGLRPYTPPTAVFDVFKREFDRARIENGLFLLTMHPHVIGYRSRIWILEELITHMKASAKVWFATHAEIARYVLK